MNTYTSTQITNPDYIPNQEVRDLDSNLVLGAGFVLVVIIYAVIMNLIKD